MKKATGKPFIKWVGGKGQLLPTIDMCLPLNFKEMDNITYIEPFVGGGAMLFYILSTYQNIDKFIINDINPDLITAYRVVKGNVDQLVEELRGIQTEYLRLTEEARKSFFLDKRDLFNTKRLTPIENTAVFIFLNKTCFNGLYRVNGQGLYNVPFGRYTNPTICDEKTLYADSELLQRVDIMCGDFELTENCGSGTTFFYFDPPYRPLSTTSSFNSYAKGSFNDNEQTRLRDFCNRLTDNNHLLMLSNSDVTQTDSTDMFFDDLYHNFIIDRVFATRSVNSNPNKRGKLRELLIRNYTPTNSMKIKPTAQGCLPFDLVG